MSSAKPKDTHMLTSKRVPLSTPELIMVYQTNPFCSGQGGGVRYVRNLSRALAGKGIRITFFGVGGTPHEEGNIRFIPLMKHPNNTVMFLLALCWARVRYVGFSNAIIHVHRLYYALPFCGRHIRLLVTLHGRTFSVFPGRYGNLLASMVFPVFKRIERRLFQSVDKMVAVSPDVIDQFLQRHTNVLENRFVDIIPSMVDLSDFQPESSTYLADRFGADEICLFVGRLAAVKNIPLLLNSWKIVIEQRRGAKLVLAGDGELREEIAQHIRDLGLSGTVEMAGPISSVEISTAIASASVLVLTSHHEASPTVVKEALSCGVPVVSTRVGDVASIIDEGRTGRVVAADASAIAGAICEVLDWGRSQQEITRAAMKTLEFCSPEAVAQRYLNIYCSLGFESGKLNRRVSD